MTSFNFKIPKRVQIDCKWWFKPFLKKRHHVVYVVGGIQYHMKASNIELAKLHVSSITIIAPSLGSAIYLLGD